MRDSTNNRTDRNLKSEEVVRMLKSGEYTIKIVYSSFCRYSYAQLKDGVKPIDSKGKKLNEAEITAKDLIDANGHKDDIELLDENKKLYEIGVYRYQEAFLDADVPDPIYKKEIIEWVEEYIEKKRSDGEKEILWGDYIDTEYCEPDPTMFVKYPEEIKIGFENYKTIKKGDFYDCEFNDYIESAVMSLDDEPMEESFAIDYYLQPMPKNSLITENFKEKKIELYELAEQEDYDIDCNKIVEILKSGNHTCKIVYQAECSLGYIQIKDDINPDNYDLVDPIEYIDLKEKIDDEENIFFINKTKIDPNKPFYSVSNLSTIEIAYLGDDKPDYPVETIDGFISQIEDFIEEQKSDNPDDIKFTDFIEAFWSGDDDWRGMWNDDNKDYIVALDVFAVQKDNFYDIVYDDIISFAFWDNEDCDLSQVIYGDFSLFIQPEQDESNNKFCPSCLEQIIVPGNFCTNCGNKLI